MKPKEIYIDMVQTLAEGPTSYTNVNRWTAEFKLGRDCKVDDFQSGRPIKRMALDDRGLTIQQIAKIIGISSCSV